MAELDAAAPTHRLALLIARDEASFDALVTGLLDIGISGATVLESRGIAAIVREDLPIFAGLAALLPTRTGSRVVLSLVTVAQVDLLQRLTERMSPDERPITIIVPVHSFHGIDG